jgi:hypothetical protein
VRLVLLPPLPPLPGTVEDERATEAVRGRAAKLAVVARLSGDPAWQSWDAYASIPPAGRASHLSAAALAGTRGVGGYQRVWFNPATLETVAVVYFGAATTGWPGVVHGGAIATMLDEHAGRVAFWVRRVMSPPAGPPAGVTRLLRLHYRKPTLADSFYVIRTQPRAEHELPPAERGKRARKVWLDSRLETPDGKLCVEAEVLFLAADAGNASDFGPEF